MDLGNLPECAVPPHPTVPDHPAGLFWGYLAEDDPRWTAWGGSAPWKAVWTLAQASGWDVRLYAARGFSVDSRGHLGPLTDTLSVRCWREHPDRDPDGNYGPLGTERAVAVWARATWPTLGRAKPGEAAKEQSGEGRSSTAGKLWLWHPPMTPPDLETNDKGVVKDPLQVAWKFDLGAVWADGKPIELVNSLTLKNRIKQPI